MCHLIGPTCLVSGQMLLLLAYIPMLLYTAHHMLQVFWWERNQEKTVEQQLPFHTVGSFIKLSLLLFLTSFVCGLMS